MLMNEDTKKVLAKNLRMLMKHKGLTQTALKEKSSVDQKTISNVLNPDSTKNSPTLMNITLLANAFGLAAWHLLIPNQPIEVLTTKEIEKLIKNYSSIDNEGRKNIGRISENETRYSNQ